MNYEDEIKKLKRRMYGLEEFLLSAQAEIEELKKHKRSTSDKIAITGIVVAAIIGIIQTIAPIIFR